MNYLFTEQDTVLVLCFLVYAGLTFVQLQKMLVLSQLGRSISPRRSLWLVARVVLILPLLWTVKYFI
ncbi:hypothetical protein IQ238_21985 [Pleurocapsales cyanobacterium LEGE 06147]|nr:hypothetical protein [Pleurocapsales cyanobacterium LEGE 06147]